MEDYKIPAKLEDIVMFDPTKHPVSKSFVVLPDFTTSAIYYDYELFRKEVGEDKVMHTFYSPDVKVGDWCMSTHGCIAQVNNIRRGRDRKGQDYSRITIANETLYFWDKSNVRRFPFTQFSRTIPTGGKTSYGKYGRQIIAFMKNGMTFFDAVRISLLNLAFDKRRQVMTTLYRNRLFIKDLTLLEVIMPNDEKTLREEIEELGMTRKEFLENVIGIVRDPNPKETPAGVASFSFKFLADALGFTTADRIPTGEDKPSTNEDAAALRQVVSSEMKSMTKGA